METVMMNKPSLMPELVVAAGANRKHKPKARTVLGYWHSPTRHLTLILNIDDALGKRLDPIQEKPAEGANKRQMKT